MNDIIDSNLKYFLLTNLSTYNYVDSQTCAPLRMCSTRLYFSSRYDKFVF